ncbi:MAG TPA: AmmeMemoRadiSam system protein B [Burkholderiaceae bacterium]|nr:AmmeMemoRadiSam system protein B [Burkholderiaceae bacterium]
MMPTTVRPAAVAGRFYPGDATALERELARCTPVHEAAAPPPKMLLVPHAGYVYSGPVAGSAYACLAGARGRIARVVLLGPTHRVAVRGLAAPGVQRFATPLGEVPVDREALARIAELPQVVTSDAAHAEEHSLEVQLPFLQRALGAFALVPLAVGRATAAEVAQVLERLWGGDETLVVISSDLSHYLPYEAARQRDAATIARVLALDAALDHDEACGATPLAGALVAARRHGLAARLLDLRNSGDTAGDRARVVGYAAVAFEAPAVPAVPSGADASGAGATGGQDEAALGRALLARARNAIAGALGHATGPEPDHDALAAPGATFVTLRRRGALRGCIGTLRAERALHEDVRVHALAAAFRDPRFPALAHAEYAELEIEVSVLGEAEPLAVASEAHALQLLRCGRDGLIFEWRGRRATFLPQVWEQLPQPAEFLRALKRKAGLPADFWAEDVRLARYEVRKFTEDGAAPLGV